MNFGAPTLPSKETPKLTNPFKKSTAIDKSCLGKAGMALVGGYGIGLFMGLFMNSVEMRDFDPTKSQKHSTRSLIRMDVKKITGMAKGFGVFGALFSVYECQMEKLRYKEDSFNSFYPGMFTTIIIASEAMGPRGLLVSGIGGGLFGMIMHKLQGNLGFM